MSSAPVIVVNGLGKRYPIGERSSRSGLLGSTARVALNMLRGWRGDETATAHHWALKDVSFKVSHGERIGVIGRNGAGKSTLLKIMSRVAYPTTGEIRIRGTLTSLLEVGTGFNDNLSGRENVFLNASLYGMTRAQIEDRFDDIVAFSEVTRFIDTPVKNYSSGMKMRLAFAVAAHLEPDILLLDEVLAVGDMSFQRKCLERVDEMTSGGRTLFLVSHSMDSIMRYCDRCIWLDGGVVRMDGDVQEVISSYVEAVLNVRSSIQVSGANTSSTEIEGTAVNSGNVATDNPPESSNQGTDRTALGIFSQSAFADENRDDKISDAEGLLSGGGGARLISARILDSSGQTKTVFGVDELVGIEMIYVTSRSGLYLPAIHVYCPQGTLVFAAVPPNTNPLVFKYETPMKLLSTAWLPADLFNIGTYSVSLVVFCPNEAPFVRYFNHEQVLSFHCIEAAAGRPSARGIMPRGFPGPIRPLLRWAVTEVADDATIAHASVAT